MYRLGALLLLALLVSLAGCNQGPRTSLAEAVSPQELAAVDLGYYWDLVIPLSSSEHVTQIWHVDENVYCLTDNGRLVTQDASTGQTKWAQRLGRPDQQFYAPTHCDKVQLPTVVGPQTVITPPSQTNMRELDVVIVDSTIDAQVRDRKTGELIERIDFARSNFAGSGSALCDGNHIYVGSVKGYFYGIDLKTGLEIWKQDAGAPITASPRLLGNMLLIAAQNGRLIATNVSQQQPRRVWPEVGLKPQATAAFSADFAAEDRGVFAGSQDYAVYAFEPQSGELMWRYPTGGGISHGIQVGANNVYARADNGKLYALAIEPGRPQEKWTLQGGSTVVAELGGKAYIIDDRNDLVVVDAASGHVESRVPMTGFSMFVPNTKAPAIYAANDKGLLVRIDPKSHGFVRPEMLK